MEILLVEDTKTDAILTHKAIQQLGIDHCLHMAENGQLAIEMLSVSENNQPIVQPSLILLDLYMPKEDGFAVLEFVKQSPSLKNVPVIILTSSAEEYDISDSVKLSADSYIVKPATREKLQAAIDAVLN